MFENLSTRLAAVVRSVTGTGRLTADNIEDAVRSVRMALIEADVALPVIKTLIERIKARAIGTEVAETVNPGHAFIKIVHSELIAIMGGAAESLNFNIKPPLVILLAGLQGVGKTSTAVKLGKWLRRRERKSVAVVSCDVYRPAAIEQLRVLSEAAGLHFIPAIAEKPVAIAEAALKNARLHTQDVLIIDTAGRLHVDTEMMQEISAIYNAVQPHEILFVVDSMAGQDSVNTSKAFAAALPLTGVILTKMDGDARGGAALSVREVTGKPIKFMGVGENSDALEVFHPERVVSRILGMGDVLSLVEEAEQKVDLQKAEKLANKIKRGKSFNLEDMKDQMQSMQKLGGIGGLLDKLPGMGGLPANLPSQTQAEQQVKQIIAIVDSMTPLERRKPDIINGSRKRRIAQGSGYQIQDVNRLLKQHKQMAKMMKKAIRGGMQNLLRGRF